MCMRSLDDALEILRDIDCHYIGLMEKTIKFDATDVEIADYKAKCAAAGVEVVSAGPLYYKDEETLRAFCRFAKRYGMSYISVVPYEVKPGCVDTWGSDRVESDKMLDALERCVREFDLRAAIHNHGPDLSNLFPDAASIWARIKDRDPRIGLCLDVGHERRAGSLPAETIRRYASRIYEVHLKNIKVDPVKNIAKEGPRGELDIPGILKALTDIEYKGYCLIELEKDFEFNEVPLAESLGYYRGIMDSIEMLQMR